MRRLAIILAAASVATPAVAKKITLSPTVSFQLVGEIEPGYDSEVSNCGLIRDGAVNMYVMPTGDGLIGNMEGDFFADDRRANFEFDFAGIKKVKRATLRFDAIDDAGDGQSDNCLFAYGGNGLVDLADYMPGDKMEILRFGMEFDPDDGTYGLDGVFDITELLKTTVASGEDFLGLQFATDNYADTVIYLSGMRIELQYAPEPGAMGLFGLGLIGIAALRRNQPKIAPQLH